jgi:hypothetical protein
MRTTLKITILATRDPHARRLSPRLLGLVGRRPASQTELAGAATS